MMKCWIVVCGALLGAVLANRAEGADPVSKPDVKGFLAAGHTAVISYCFPEASDVYMPVPGTNPAQRMVPTDTAVTLGDASPLVTVTLAPNTLTIGFVRKNGQNNAWDDAPFHGVVVQDAAALRVGDLTVDEDQIPEGFTSDRVTIAGNKILVNFQNLAPYEGQQVIIHFLPTQSPTTEPATQPAQPPRDQFRVVFDHRIEVRADRDEAAILVQIEDPSMAKGWTHVSTGPMSLARAIQLHHLLGEFRTESRYSVSLNEFRFGVQPKPSARRQPSTRPSAGAQP